ncbi:MAG: transketolase [Halanaerobiaceae bacterium]
MIKKTANIVRGLSADAVEAANSGHPGMPMGCAEIGSLLYGKIMKHDPENPDWPDRDRFVLSAGHGSMLMYSLLHLSGYDLPLDELKNFRQLDSKTPGHPEYGHTEGVETTTGPLGQGFTNAVGMALTERMLAEKFNTEQEIVDHYTYTIAGDGCMMEGVTSEAASLAGHLGLGKLIAIYDDNQISIAGNTDLAFTESVPERFKAYGWHVIEDVDGHKLGEVEDAISEAKSVTDKPTIIIAYTHIAFGAPNKQDTSAAHGAPLGEDEVRAAKKKLGLPEDEKFYISEEVKEFFAGHKEELARKYEKWQAKFAKWSKNNPELREQWDQAFNLEVPANLEKIVNDVEIETPIATRKASGAVLRAIADQMDYLVGGSADLAPSTKTYLDKYDEVQRDNYGGRNFRFGVREHAMGAVVNGMALHQGVRVFNATFLVFSDYMRPAIRLAALMKQPVIYVFTHDSIAIGEDGPTHQPVEHVEALRLIPNLKVLRPADEQETKRAWLEAINHTEGPTALVFTRQNLPHIEKEKGLKEFSKGAYIVRKGSDDPEIVLLASGSEVSLACDVADQLAAEGKEVRIVSVPDREEFISRSQQYQDKVLGGKDNFRVAIEAGVGSGWYQLLGQNSLVVSVEDFGCSAPGEEVYAEFGFTADKVTSRILKKM